MILGLCTLLYRAVASQMGDNSEVMRSIDRKEGISYPVLTPNLKVRLFTLSFAVVSGTFDLLALPGL